MSDTYTAYLIGNDRTENIELEFINGLPQKSFVRPVEGDPSDELEEVVWELVPDSEDFTYRVAGVPGADYS